MYEEPNDELQETIKEYQPTNQPNNTMKFTRTEYVRRYPEMNKMRKNDPIQFSVLFNEWVRKNKK